MEDAWQLRLGFAISGPLLLCGATLGFRCQPWERLAAIYVIEGQRQAFGFGKVNQQSRHIRRHALALFVVIHVPLGAAERIAEDCLRDLKALTNAFDGVHTRNTSGACLSCQ